MQYGFIKLIGATALATTAAAVACADYSGSNTSASAGSSSTAGSASVGGASSAAGGSASTGGQKSTGGSGPATGGSGSATGGAANCPSTTLCGSGDVTGTWNVTSSCLTVSGELDFSNVSIGCASAPISGGQLQVTGSWSAGIDGDGLYTDNTNTKGTVYFTLAAPCLSISNSPPSSCSGIAGSLVAAGFTTKTVCTSNASGGCDCAGDVDNGQGSIGVPSGSPGTNDMYATDSNLLTMSNGHDQTPYSYCVSGSTLTLSPQPAHPTITGTVVLQK
jgi:hypothetical protein